MTAKEKANELIDKYTSVNGNSFFAKECIIIAVDEIIEELKREPYTNYERIIFWKAVKPNLKNYEQI